MHENRHILDIKKRELKHMVLHMASMTGESFEQSLQCLKQYDSPAAEAMISKDVLINELHDQAEHAGFYVIASQQPVAHDLREIVVAMRIAGELERIADHVASIARIRGEIALGELNELQGSDIGQLGLDVQTMFDLAVASFDDLDTGEAHQLKSMETRIDESTGLLTDELFRCMKNNTALIEDGSRVLWIVHTLERIADRTTNIAEQVIYAVTAQDEKMN
jgi:phosphate transport system protein